MKLAMPNNGNMLNRYFGESKSFIIATVDNRELKSVDEISTENIIHRHHGLSDLFAKNGVNLVITGDIGQWAIDALKKNGLEVISGASGEYNKVIDDYLNGILKSKEVLCDN